MAQQQNGSYSFTADPRAVPHGRKQKYRQEAYDEEGPETHGNIMYDARVVRGSTFASRTMPAGKSQRSSRRRVGGGKGRMRGQSL